MLGTAASRREVAAVEVMKDPGPDRFNFGSVFEGSLQIERGEGFYLGSLSLNYGVTLVCYLLPVMLLAVYGVIGTTTAIVLAAVGLVLMAKKADLALAGSQSEFGPDYYAPVDIVGLYWHLVDLIWIFLFPLLYLIR